MAMTFNQIPTDWRVPGVYIEVAPNYANLGLMPIPTKILVIGQGLESGTAAPLTPVRCPSASDARQAFGAGSLLSDMVAVLRQTNTTQDVYAIALPDDPAGIAAKATLTVGGVATASGPVTLLIGGRRVRVRCGQFDTATILAQRLVEAINAARLMVTASVAEGGLTLINRHAGVFGNDLALAVCSGVEAPPPGLFLEAGCFSGGAANPEILQAFAALGDTWFTDVVCPYTDAFNLDVLSETLQDRYGAMSPHDAHAYTGLAAGFVAASTLGATLNCPHLSVIAAHQSPSPPWEWAAALGGVAAFHLTNDPARHLRTLSLPGIQPPPMGFAFSTLEQDLLLRDGISTWSAGEDGTVHLERVITTYQNSATGFDDPAWLDIVTPKTLTRIRYDWRAYLSLNYPRHKLADNDSTALGEGKPVMTPRLMHAVWAGRCAKYEEEGWLEGTKETVKQSHFERDTTDRNRMNSRQPVRVIGQLMVIAGRLEFEV